MYKNDNLGEIKHSRETYEEPGVWKYILPTLRTYV
jgi:hypothetical protein